MTKLDWINLLTMGGMVVVGVCLMLGLLTPLAALGAVFYLTLFYPQHAPLAGRSRRAPHVYEGHYLFVNKNLIELIACLVIASTPNGLWIGLDAILFGARARRKAAAREARRNPPTPTGRDDAGGSNPEPARVKPPKPAHPARSR